MQILWFRNDLRLTDNPALRAAAGAGEVLPVYILDDASAGKHAMGAASRWWLHHSLMSLNEALQGGLRVFKGDAETVLLRLAREHKAEAVYFNRRYEPWRMENDTRVEKALQSAGVKCESFNASLLWEPWEVSKNDGTFYKVFTPFYRKGCLNAAPPRAPLPKPKKIDLFHAVEAPVDALELLPRIRWDKQLAPHWDIGEEGAKEQLRHFLRAGLARYKEGRNFPAMDAVSRLSPRLHFGELSPHQVWHAVKEKAWDANSDSFCSELGWREFAHHLLHHFPALPTQNLQAKFDGMEWQGNREHLKRWQQGMTGYPLVDAGMRELWQTGFMHNRVRMVVGSFLVKNLLIDWREGERWFWDCLVDADLAQNSFNWQWIAGCGADAAPYFRVFNPTGQAEKFDGEGEYIRRFVPELAKLPTPDLFNPSDAPAGVLRAAGVELGVTYPKPMVDVAASRERALAAFRALRSGE